MGESGAVCTLSNRFIIGSAFLIGRLFLNNFATGCSIYISCPEEFFTFKTLLQFKMFSSMKKEQGNNSKEINSLPESCRRSV